MSGRILFVPSVVKGNGSGHLVRCLSLAKALGPGAAVFVLESKGGGSWTAAELSLAYSKELVGVPLVTELHPQQGWDLVVLDRRTTSAEEVSFWERMGPVLAIDEGGNGRASASYLVDVLPRLNMKKAHARLDGPNRASMAYLDLPVNRRDAPREFKRVLVTFGGEDPAGLALVLSRSLVASGTYKAEDLTIVSGALRKGAPPEGLDGATLLGPVQDLKDHLYRYDIVFTQFGLTAYEAAYAGCCVILLNPSFYHEALSRIAGFPDIGVIKPNLSALGRYLAKPAQTMALVSGLAPESRESLAALISGLEVSGPRGCPRCSSFDRRALFRDEEKSYFRCSSCGLIYLERFSPARKDPYKESYFFDEYRKQYGKTYLEDWPSLTSLASSRLAVIEGLATKSLGRSSGLTLLDVGCAYGPYLAAAHQRGQEPYGLDVSEDAARYVRRELGIPAAFGDFLDPSVAATFGGPFDVLSMWYVIEHFGDLDRALRNAAALVRPGGIFAFSTPSGEGISAKGDPGSFFATSPFDHFTIWEPSQVRGILKAYGFRVERIRITGHHPERFPIAKKRGQAGPGQLLRALLGLWSRIFGLGDTFEVYAVREEAPAPSSAASRKEKRARAAPEQ